MAGILRADDIDFAAYMRDTECKAKVRAAGAFEADLLESFDRTKPRKKAAAMFSSRLGALLEFRPGEVTVWAGFSGHRKSTFSGQVMAELCHQGQRVLACSYEMLPSQTLTRMARQTLGGNEFSASTIRGFMDWTRDRLWILDHMGRLSPEKQLAFTSYFANQKAGQHVFIDSMQFVCQSEESIDEQKQFMTDLVRCAQESGLHLHLIAHCRKPSSGDESKPPSKHDIRGTAAIGDQAHNIVMCWYDRARRARLEVNPHDEEQLAKPAALITVEKQRNGAFEGRLQYWHDDASLRFTDKRTTAVESWLSDAWEGGN